MSIQSEELRRYFALNGIKNTYIQEVTGLSSGSVSNILSGKDSLWHITLQPDTYKRVVNANLQKLATLIGLPTGVTMYWARHTLASLLYEQGASMEVVSASLGHSYGSRVTLTYIDIRMSEVDKQFRMLLDKLLHDEG